MGRPTKLTPETHRRIVEAIGAGRTKTAAAAAAGITEATLHGWIKKGRSAPQGSALFDFFEDVQDALAVSEISLFEKIWEATDRDWRAAAWLLARRFRHWQEKPRPSAEMTEELLRLQIEREQLRIDLVASIDRERELEGLPEEREAG